VAAVVGDGEAETGPLATSWHSNKFLNPATDGAVLPILHLNGYKIANPACSRASATRNWSNFSAATVTRRFSSKAATGEDAPAHGRGARPGVAEIQRVQTPRARNGSVERPRWPMIVLRSPKGWTCPEGN
jgi:xylulose-5-phosphate/fructose-6-phosphate phosphoketolase